MVIDGQQQSTNTWAVKNMKLTFACQDFSPWHFSDQSTDSWQILSHFQVFYRSGHLIYGLNCCT